MYGFGETTVARAIRNGELPVCRVGRRIVIPIDDVEKWIGAARSRRLGVSRQETHRAAPSERLELDPEGPLSMASTPALLEKTPQIEAIRDPECTPELRFQVGQKTTSVSGQTIQPKVGGKRDGDARVWRSGQ
jgi:excisionase family DNA binding protein